MKRIIVFSYGVAAYLLVTLAFLYLVGFIGNWIVPRTIDTGPSVGPLAAVSLNLLLMSAFALQHSGMARKGFKKTLNRLMPAAVERSTYLIATSGVLALLFWLWRPMPGTIWQVDQATARIALYGVFVLGWVLILAAIYLIDFWGFFGLRQVHAYLRRRHTSNPGFVTPLIYQFIRHPIYLGLLLGLWSTPRMTQGHLLFAATMTVYILFAARLEERDLTASLGERYREYQREVPMLVPLPGRRALKSRQPTPH